MTFACPRFLSAHAKQKVTSQPWYVTQAPSIRNSRTDMATMMRIINKLILNLSSNKINGR